MNERDFKTPFCRSKCTGSHPLSPTVAGQIALQPEVERVCTLQSLRPVSEKQERHGSFIPANPRIITRVAVFQKIQSTVSPVRGQSTVR